MTFLVSRDYEKRGPLRITSSAEVLGKPIRTDVMIVAHAYMRENHYATYVRCQKFPRFPLNR